MGVECVESWSMRPRLPEWFRLYIMLKETYFLCRELISEEVGPYQVCIVGPRWQLPDYNNAISPSCVNIICHQIEREGHTMASSRATCHFLWMHCNFPSFTPLKAGRPFLPFSEEHLLFHEFRILVMGLYFESFRANFWVLNGSFCSHFFLLVHFWQSLFRVTT